MPTIAPSPSGADVSTLDQLLDAGADDVTDPFRSARSSLVVKVIAAACALVICMGLLFGSGLIRIDTPSRGSQPQAADPVVAPPASAAPPVDSTPHGDPGTTSAQSTQSIPTRSVPSPSHRTDDEAVADAAFRFVAAFYDYGYPDRHADEWIRRSRPLMTAEYADAVAAQFTGGDDHPAWLRMQQQRQRRIAKVAKVAVARPSDGAARASVVHQVETVTARPDGTMPEISVAAPSRTVTITLVEQDGRWLVAGTRLTP